LVCVRCVVPIYKQILLQIVIKDSVSPLPLGFIEKTVRAHCVQLLVRSVDKQAEHTIQIVFQFREIFHLTFSSGAHDFLLRNTANKEPFLLWIVRNSLWDQLRISETKRDSRIRRSRFVLRKLLPNLLELGIAPRCFEPGVAHWNKSQLPTFQAA
jgi:hypothetical protein